MGSSRERTRRTSRYRTFSAVAVMCAFVTGLLVAAPNAYAEDELFKKGPDGQYEINTSVWFPSNAKRFRPRYRGRLKKIAAFLKKHPEIKLLQLIGHADSRGAEALNARLSGVRARFVKDTLIGMGVDASRLQVVGKGGEEAGHNNRNPRGRGMNRRVDFIVVYGDLPAATMAAADTPAETTEEVPPEDEEAVEAGEGEEGAGEGEGESNEEEVADGEAEVEEPTEEALVDEEATEEEPTEEEATEEEATEEETPEEEKPAEELVEEPGAEPLVAEEVDERIELPNWLEFLEPYVNVAVRSEPTHWVQDNPQWIAAGVTSAALLTAVTLDFMSIHKAMSDDEFHRGTKGAADNTKAHADYRNGALIFYALSAAGAAGSAWLYLDDYMDLFEPRVETSIQLVPTEGGAMLNLQMPFGRE